MDKEKIIKIIQQSISTKQQILDNVDILKSIEKSKNAIMEALKNEKRIWFCGNGGSCADAEHIASEMCGRIYKDRRPLPVQALHCNSAYLTAVANDYGYDFIYSRLVVGQCSPGDVVFGLSTSGNSKNIVNAFLACKEKNITTIGLMGMAAGVMSALSDIEIKIPSTDSSRIQEGHVLVGHILCQLVEEQFFAL